VREGKRKGVRLVGNSLESMTSLEFRIMGVVGEGKKRKPAAVFSAAL